MTIEFMVPTLEQEEDTDQSFMNKKRFSKMVERIVRGSGMTYLDSVVHVCETNGMEVEDVKKYLTSSILEKLEFEAMSLNFLKRGNALDV